MSRGGKTVPYTTKTFLEKMEENGIKDIEILGKYKNAKTKIKCKCKKNEKHIWEAFPWNILKGVGCPFCNGKKVLREESIGFLYPEYIKYFKNKEDAFNFSPQSGKYVNLICPECGTEKRGKIQNLFLKGFSCAKCKDGISYPNKFMRSFLKLLNIDFEQEWNSEWCKKYRYDFKFNYNGVIILIECDGALHYKQNGLSSLDHTKETDKRKNMLAREYNCILIRINCFYSNPNFIYNSIKNSILSRLFDLNYFNLEECKKMCETCLVKEVCSYYEEHLDKTITEIAKIYKINIVTVIKYLKRGKELGFSPHYINNNSKSIFISILDKKGNILKTYKSIKECAKDETFIKGLTERKIGLTLNTETKEREGYFFKKVTSYKDIANDFMI